MIAEDTQPPAHGRESRPRPGTTPDTLHAPAVDPPAGTTGQLTVSQAVANLVGDVERPVDAL
ncbi:hypothetical protein OG689_43265 [Kitasatospora sp. NBC_00240]|uniref:hypothetical protein n=1 Tax=Kitasatospora sp. NBC_00240 TaxID=2903567 RepID=UPI002254CCC4|nr:hypothetical protein [Kitasatospora sp. NBC_00240]MCX5215961.1 hypothetical protein [Kitasatospora sp. NBC_00240]